MGKKYNRSIDHRVAKDIIDLQFKQKIDEDIEKEDLELALERFFNFPEERRQDLFAEFADNYLSQNKPVQCNGCKIIKEAYCLLIEGYQCNTIGIKIEQRENKFMKGDSALYHVVKKITNTNNI